VSLYEDAQEEALRRLQAMAAAGAAPAVAPPVAPPRALPRATRKASAGGALSGRVQPGEENIRRGLELMSAEDDYTAASDFARQRSLQGEDAMLNAIAASVAGRRFEPLQGAFLKRAMAAQDPMKVGTATIGPDGTVLRDPSAGREREAGRLLQLGQFEMGLADRQQARADALAACIDDVVRDLVDQRHARGQTLADDGIDPAHRNVDEAARLERWRGADEQGALSCTICFRL
jgi:hypothetical protein